jgi:hypothetical protein
MLILQTDESETQTRRVIIRLFRDAIEPPSQEKLASIIAKHWAYQRMLGQCRVIIPEALGVKLAGAMPHSRPECRRLARQVIAMMKASAVAHQFQRERRDDCIIASKRDYEIAYRLLATPAAVQLGKQPHQAYYRLFEKLRQRYGSNEFTTADALELAGMSRRWTYNALAWFASNNIAERLTPGRGSRAALWRLVANEIRAQDVLPNPDCVGDADGPPLPDRQDVFCVQCVFCVQAAECTLRSLRHKGLRFVHKCIRRMGEGKISGGPATSGHLAIHTARS